MARKEIRRKIYRQMWAELRIEYLAVTFAVALATVSFLQDITTSLTSRSGVIEIPFKYALAVAETVGNAIRMIKETEKGKTNRS
jgi:hypothetical protein